MSILGRSLWFSTGSPPTFVASAKGANTVGGTTLVISKPTGTQENDIMIAFMCAQNTTTWTGDTGWTEVIDQGSNPDIRIAYLIAGPSEGSSYTFTSASSRTLSGIIVTYRGGSYDTVGSINTSNPIVAPQITASTKNSILLGFFASGSAGITYSTPTGMSSIDSDSDANNPSFALFSETINAGATGSRTSTPSVGTVPGGVLLSIKPG